MDGLRLDKWLWFARFYKSRSLAQRTIEGGAVLLNGRPAAKADAARVGDQVEIPLGRIRRRVVILALGQRRGPAPEAALLYRHIADLEMDM